MQSKRKKYKQEFQAKVALEAVKEKKTVHQIAQEFRIHPNQVANWKKKAIEKLPGVFADPQKVVKAEAGRYDREELLREIGRLQIELEFLKKNTWV